MALQVLLCALSWTVCEALLAKTSHFEVVMKQDVTSYEAVTSTRSLIECMEECTMYSHCISAAYSRALRLCYLHPSNVVNSAGPAALTIYRNTNPVCSESNPSLVTNADVTSWRRSLTSLEADISCQSGFIFSNTDTPRLSCQSTGTWVLNGACHQRLWTINTVSLDTPYSFPRTAFEGGWLCLTGVPSSKFSVNLLNDEGDNLLHMDARFFYYGSSAVVFDAHIEGSWRGSHHITASQHPFPFSEGQLFTLIITARGVNQLDVYVDSDHLHTWTIPMARTVDSISQVNLKNTNSLLVHSMDLYCSTTPGP